MKLYSVFTLEKRDIAAVTLNKKDKTAKNENVGQNTIWSLRLKSTYCENISSIVQKQNSRIVWVTLKLAFSVRGQEVILSKRKFKEQIIRAFAIK